MRIIDFILMFLLVVILFMVADISLRQKELSEQVRKDTYAELLNVMDEVAAANLYVTLDILSVSRDSVSVSTVKAYESEIIWGVMHDLRKVLEKRYYLEYLDNPENSTGKQ